MLKEFLTRERAALLPQTAKGVPTSAYGQPLTEVLAAKPRREDFWTPLVTLDAAALTHNLDLMATWAVEHDLQVMPHGKTTMSPNFWQRQLQAGARGIALATLGQVRMARSAGLDSIMLANEAVDPEGLAWLSGQHADPNFDFWCWADSTEAVRAMDRALAAHPPARKINVLVEFGVAGGSAYFDLVAEVYAEHRVGAPGETHWVIRPGAYVTHDEGLPTVTGIADSLAGPFADIEAEATVMNDQHAFIRLPEGTQTSVGYVLRFGLSHLCTAFDKWPVMPVIDADGAVTDLVRTYF